MSFNSPFSNPNQNTNNETASTNAPPAGGSDVSRPNIPAYGDALAEPTGKNSILSIVGLVLAILFPLIGLIVSIVAWKHTAETGDNRGLAKAGIIVGSVLFILSMIYTFVMFGEMTTATMHGTLSSS